MIDLCQKSTGWRYPREVVGNLNLYVKDTSLIWRVGRTFNATEKVMEVIPNWSETNEWRRRGVESVLQDHDHSLLLRIGCMSVPPYH
jgi:hypothetical protein